MIEGLAVAGTGWSSHGRIASEGVLPLFHTGTNHHCKLANLEFGSLNGVLIPTLQETRKDA